MQDIYTHNYKKLMLVPLAIILPILFFILISPGITLGTELTGGNVLIIRSDKELSTPVIEDIIKTNFDLTQVSVSTINSPTGFGAYIQYSKNPKVLEAESLIEQAQVALDADNETDSIAKSNAAIVALGGTTQTFSNAKLALTAATDALSAYNKSFSEKLQNVLSEKLALGSNAQFQQREVSATLGKASLNSGIFIVLVSAILLILVIFVSFRQVIPVLGIVFAMAYDVLFGLGGMALLHIPLSLVAISTLLMVVGYSVDTDILLTSRMLKDKSATPGERATAAVKTGVTMNATVLAALIAMLVVSTLYAIDVVQQIAIILIFGLVGDIIATWFMNVSILMWFLEKKGTKV